MPDTVTAPKTSLISLLPSQQRALCCAYFSLSAQLPGSDQGCRDLYELTVHWDLHLPAHGEARTVHSPSFSLQCLTQCLAHGRHSVNAYSMSDEGKLKPEKSKDLKQWLEDKLP